MFIFIYMYAKSLQSCPTLCDPMNCSLPGSSVHGVLQARILEWVAMPSSRGSSQPRDWTLGLLHCRRILYHWAIEEAWITKWLVKTDCRTPSLGFLIQSFWGRGQGCTCPTGSRWGWCCWAREHTLKITASVHSYSVLSRLEAHEGEASNSRWHCQ